MTRGEIEEMRTGNEERREEERTGEEMRRGEVEEMRTGNEERRREEWRGERCNTEGGQSY